MPEKTNYFIYIENYVKILNGCANILICEIWMVSSSSSISFWFYFTFVLFLFSIVCIINNLHDFSSIKGSIFTVQWRVSWQLTQNIWRLRPLYTRFSVTRWLMLARRRCHKELEDQTSTRSHPFIDWTRLFRWTCSTHFWSVFSFVTDARKLDF